MKRFVIVFVLLNVFPHALASQARSCTRPPAYSAALGAVIALSEVFRFPCVIQLLHTGVALRADSAGVVADIGNSVVQSPAGRFFTSAKTGEVSVWDRSGKFLFNFGRIGRGPGEFAAGPKHFLLDARGRLFVGDNNVRWSVFGSDNDYEMNFSAATLGIGAAGCCSILDDGTFLSGWGGVDGAFRIYEIRQRSAPTPTVIRAFGDREKAGRNRRRIAYAGGSTFWSAPDDESGSGYVLEQWRTDGVRLRTIRREVSWMPKGVEASGVLAPELLILHQDSSGLLYVSYSIKQRAFASLSPADQRNRLPGSPADKAIDRYFEVIDTKANLLLVSTGPMRPSEAEKLFPAAFFQSSSRGYQFDESAEGLPVVRIVEVKLVRK